MRHELPSSATWGELPRTAADARRLGSRWYFTGQPCSHGHVALRRTSNQTCVECARRHSAIYVEKHIKPAAEERRRQREAERPMREAARKERQRLRLRENYCKRMREEGTEAVRAEIATRSRERYSTNAQMERERTRARRAKGLVGWRALRLRTPPWLTENERKQMKAIYASRTKTHSVVDHYVPIDPCGIRRIAGLHVPWQLKVISQAKNTQRVGVTFTPDEEADLVRRGFAVWAEDVDENGFVDWSRYGRPRGE